MSLLRSGLWLSAGIAVGRVAGFVREVILARAYGTGPEADVAVLVLTLPDSLLNLLIGSAMGLALVPALAAQRQRNGVSGVDRLQTQVAVLAAGLGLLLSIGTVFGAAAVVQALAPGLHPEQVSRASDLVATALWAIPLTVLSAVLGAGLQERERFATTALGTLWFNGAVIVALLLWQGTLAAMAWAMVAGAALRLAIQLAEWRSAGGGWAWGPWTPERRMLIAYLEALGAGAALVLLPIAGRWFASFAGEGAIARYTYATRLYELPLQVLVTVFATAIFPRFTQLLAINDARAPQLRDLALAVVAVAAFGAALIGLVAAPWLIQIAFRLQDPEVAAIVRALLPGLPLAGGIAVLQAWYAARNDTRTPLLASTAGVLVFLALGWPALRLLGLNGLAWLATAQLALVLGWLVVRDPTPLRWRGLASLAQVRMLLRR